MKKSKIRKPVFFVVFFLIVIFAILSTVGIKTYNGDIQTHYIRGLSDIRWGRDIRGGVEAVFGVPDDYGTSVSTDELNAAKSILETRLISKSINDYEVFTDPASNTIIVRFPWQSDDDSFDPVEAVKEIGETALLTFREKHEVDSTTGKPTGATQTIILTGSDVKSAQRLYDTEKDEYIVRLDFKSSGAQKFKDATTKLKGDTISIWMDDECLSWPTVNEVISDGTAIISGSFTVEKADKLANQINGGALPFKLDMKSLSTTSANLGTNARDAMAIAGLIAFGLIAVFMIAYYRLPGFVAVIALAGQVAGMFAAITGFFGFNDASTLTLPGIAGIILSIGMGVDANVISAERIREELKAGRTIDGALKNGFSRGFTAILDSNLTVIIVALILMIVFGPWSGVSADGTIYSFGFTLLAGVIMNFIMACWATRLMTISLSKFKCFRKPELYGVARADIGQDIEKGKTTSQNIEVKAKTNYDFVGRRKIFLIASGVLLAAAVIFTFALKVNVDIRFTGGTIITYSYDGTVNADEIKDTIEAQGSDIRANVTTGESFSADGMKTITVSFASTKKMSEETLIKINDSLKEKYPENNITSVSETNVAASAGSRFFVSCLIAVLVAFVLLVIYIAFRFKKIGGLSAGVIAILCLLHDVAVTYSVYVYGGMTLDANFMAVILTLLGYSINNTIIIYDRLRENRTKWGGKMSDRELVNLSVNQTLSRSIITTVTTVMAMISISIVCSVMNVTSILTFSIPLAVGMIVGFYSSLCLAGPLWIWYQEKRKPSKKETSAKKTPKKA